MENIKSLAFFIGLVLVVTICLTESAVNVRKFHPFLKHSSNKLQDTGCISTTVHDKACHGERCHNTTTYIHGCDTYDPLWDNLTVRFDVQNATGWRNTTCKLRAAWEPPFNDDDCGFANMTYESCTNGDCRSGAIDVRACLVGSSEMSYFSDAAAYSALDDDGDELGDFFDIPCVNLLFDTVRRRRHFATDKK